jgi:hypothetical protein
MIIGIKSLATVMFVNILLTVCISNRSEPLVSGVCGCAYLVALNQDRECVSWL